MAKSIKLSNDTYWDSSSVVHKLNNTEKKNLQTFLKFICSFCGGYDRLVGYSDNLDTTNCLITISTVNPVGFPSGFSGNGCMVITSSSDNMYKAQLAFNFGDDKLAIRRRHNSTTWTNWKYVSFS